MKKKKIGWEDLILEVIENHNELPLKNFTPKFC